MAEPMSTWEGIRAVARGVRAVVVLFLTAADALVTAVMGVPPIACTWRRVRLAVSEEYRRGYWDAIEDAEVIEPGPDDGPPEEGDT
jgi:hypothetical protein